MKALIIGAGQGKRLLPLTETKPKALLDVGGKSLLAWQVDALMACGIDDIVFVAGFNIAAVDTALAEITAQRPNCRLRAVYNPFFAVADNLATCWMARAEMAEDFVLLNGDTLFSAPILQRLLDSPESPITLVIDHKPHYDADDMKVTLDGEWLSNIGKDLADDCVDGESIGMLLFRGAGPGRFVAALDSAMQNPSAIRQWYLSVIAALAGQTEVRTVSVGGHEWCEIDYPLDFKKAQELAARWHARETDMLSSVGTR